MRLKAGGAVSTADTARVIIDDAAAPFDANTIAPENEVRALRVAN